MGANREEILIEGQNVMTQQLNEAAEHNAILHSDLLQIIPQRAPEADDESVEDGIFLMKLYGSNSVRFEKDGEKEYFICSGQKKSRNKKKKRIKKKYVDSVVLYECPVQRSINVRRLFHMFVAQYEGFLPQKNINECKFGVRTLRANDLVEVIEGIRNELYSVDDRNYNE